MVCLVVSFLLGRWLYRVSRSVTLAHGRKQAMAPMLLPCFCHQAALGIYNPHSCAMISVCLEHIKNPSPRVMRPSLLLLLVCRIGPEFRLGRVSVCRPPRVMAILGSFFLVCLRGCFALDFSLPPTLSIRRGQLGGWTSCCDFVSWPKRVDGCSVLTEQHNRIHDLVCFLTAPLRTPRIQLGPSAVGSPSRCHLVCKTSTNHIGDRST